MSTVVTRNLFLLTTAVLLAVFVAPGEAHSAEQQVTHTTVTVEEMCGGCVKRITARFDQEKNVAEVKCDIKKKSVTIIPAKNIRLSPRGLWEIMESIGKTPQKLVGPDGTFTSKPSKT